MDSEPQKSPWALCRVCNAMSGIIWEFSEEGVCGRDSNDWSLWDSEVTREQIICRSKLHGLKHTSKRSSVYQNLKQTLKRCRLKCPTLKSQNKGRPRCSSSNSISKKKKIFTIWQKWRRSLQKASEFRNQLLSTFKESDLTGLNFCFMFKLRKC